MYLTKLASLHALTPEASLLVNGLSGAVDLVNSEEAAYLRDIRLGRPARAEQYRESLGGRGYVFANEREERAALQEVYEDYRQLACSKPVQFVICPTYTCNLACSYCFESPRLRSRAQVMTVEQVRGVFAAIESLANTTPDKPCQIVLFGGEPLLPVTRAAVAAILQGAKERGCRVQIVTNGTHLASFASLLGRYRGTVKGAQITLDGTQPIHDARRGTAAGRGSFADIVPGVEACLALGVEVSLRVNLDAQNLGALEEFVTFLEARGWMGRKGFRCQLAPVTDHLGTSTYPFMMGEDELVEPVLRLWERRPDLRAALDFRLFRVLHHLISVIEDAGEPRTLPRFHYCEVDRGESFAFGPDGLIYVCPESVGSEEHAVGSYHPAFLLWPERLEQWQNRSVLTLPECQECSIATFCGGGCAYAALRHYGSPMHGVCGRTREILHAYMRLLQRRFQANSLLSSASVRVNPPSQPSVTGDVEGCLAAVARR